jgi:hypothetical protein
MSKLASPVFENLPLNDGSLDESIEINSGRSQISENANDKNVPISTAKVRGGHDLAPINSTEAANVILEKLQDPNFVKNLT